MVTSASERFERQYNAIVRAEAKIGRALDSRQTTWFKKANVIGYGVGRKDGELAVVFFVRRKVKPHDLAQKDRLPRFIVVAGRRIPVDVRKIAMPRQRMAEPIGDARGNRKSYHTDGQGSWKMGVGISVWERHHPNDPAEDKGEATAGARVLSNEAGDTVPKVLSCAHVLKQSAFEVAQYYETKSTASAFLNNFVGSVLKVSQNEAEADGGLVECIDAEREIMHIGLPREPRFPIVGLYVMKSGYATGLTWSQIAVTHAKCKIREVPEPSSGMFAIDNFCVQDPAGPGKRSTEVPDNAFDWEGDSGSLIVIGKPNAPGQWGLEGLQKTYDAADAQQKAVINDRWERAALGLLCAGGRKYTFGQLIEQIMTALDVHLDI